MLYRILLFLHISFIATWIGGSFMFSLLGSRAKKLGPPQPEMVVRTLESAEWLGRVFYGPLIGLTLISGVALVLESGLGFGHFFVIFGLGMILIAGAMGGGFFARRSKALIAHISERGVDAEAQAGLAQIFIASKILMVLLFLTIFVMTYKPFQ